MTARGPDDAGYSEISGPGQMLAQLGHRRLSIQDLSAAGAQPMRAAAGRYTIIYNGEIYNTAELRGALAEKGFVPRSTGDTELVLEGFAVWGPAVLDRLHGIFAFAIFDEETGAVFLARDRLGIKPLYVTQAPGSLAVSSDARALRDLGYGPALDPEALALYLMLGYVPSPRSIWTGIEKLEAGEWMWWHLDERVERGHYWRAPDATDTEGDSGELADLIDTVVEEQLLSDVPVGLFLSAGIDSSIIASSVAGLGSLASKVCALSVSFPDNPARDEAAMAERTAAQLGLDIKRLALSGDPNQFHAEAMATLDEPLGFTAIATQAAVSRLAAEAGLKVVLSGDGGDEVFGGYRWYDPLQTAAVPPRIRPMDFRTWARARDYDRDTRFRQNSWLFDHAQSVLPSFRPDHVADMLEDMTLEHAVDLLETTLSRHDAPNLPAKRRAQRLDLMTFCSDAIVAKVDRAGMAYSIEARPPLLDHRIVEWGLSRPVTPAFDDEPKSPLRAILRARGLHHLVDLPKRGFSLNVQHRRSRLKYQRQIGPAMHLVGLQRWRRNVDRSTHAVGTKRETLSLLAHWIEGCCNTHN